jgi:hypothetical protein
MIGALPSLSLKAGRANPGALGQDNEHPLCCLPSAMSHRVFRDVASRYGKRLRFVVSG